MAIVGVLGQLPHHNLTIILPRKDVRERILAGPDEFSGKSEKICPINTSAPDSLRGRLDCEVSLIDGPELP